MSFDKSHVAAAAEGVAIALLGLAAVKWLYKRSQHKDQRKKPFHSLLLL